MEIETIKEELVNQYGRFTNHGGWFVELLVLIGIVACVTLFLSRLALFLERRPFFRRSTWRHTFLSALRAPLILVVWTTALSLMAHRLHQLGHLDRGMELITTLCALLYAIAIGWFLFRWKRRVQLALYEQVRRKEVAIQRGQVLAIGKLATIFIALFTLFLILDALHVDMGVLLTLGGVGGVVIGFAGKDLFSNFFGGFMVHATRPFDVGDWVNSPDKSIEGIVESIGWYITRIRAFDKQPIYVPNALFSTIVLVNPSRMSHRQFKTALNLRYSDFKLAERLLQEVKSYLTGHPAIDTEQDLIVTLEFGVSSLDIQISCYCKTIDKLGWVAIQQELYLEFARIVHTHGADFAYPTQTIYLQQEQN